MTMSITAWGRLPSQASEVTPASTPASTVASTSTTASAASTAADTSTAISSSDEANLTADLKAPEVRHFPWLSRLTASLDAAAVQKSPFAAAPMVGETLNKAA